MQRLPEAPEQTEAACHDRAMELLSRRPHSVEELRRKLKRKKFRPDLVEAELNNLLRLNLLDDRLLAEDYCRQKLNASPPVGRKRVFMDLRRHGIDAELAEDALKTIWDVEDRDGNGELNRATAAAERKLRLLGNEDDPRKRRAKLFRHLASRGFAGDVCARAIERVRDS